QTSSEIHNSSLPFDKQARQYTFHEAQEVKFFKENYFSKDPWRQISDDWLSFATELALKLDRDTNNTSLALAIELVESGKVLLFPGDAQVGNWESWQDRTWKVDGLSKKADAEPLKIVMNDLFKRTVFYKVGHHGSHNATLKDKGLELMTHPELVAFIPVSGELALRKKWRMPFEPLYQRLQTTTKGCVVRADNGIPESAPTAPE